MAHKTASIDSISIEDSYDLFKWICDHFDRGYGDIKKNVLKYKSKASIVQKKVPASDLMKVIAHFGLEVSIEIKAPVMAPKEIIPPPPKFIATRIEETIKAQVADITNPELLNIEVPVPIVPDIVSIERPAIDPSKIPDFL